MSLAAMGWTRRSTTWLRAGLPANTLSRAVFSTGTRVVRAKAPAAAAKRAPPKAAAVAGDANKQALYRLMVETRTASRANGTPFEVTLYERDTVTHSMLMHVGAAVQLAFWLNAAWFAYDYYGQPEDIAAASAVEEEAAVVTPTDAKAPANATESTGEESSQSIASWQRVTATLGLTMMGGILSALMVMYTRRTVRRLELIEQGRCLRITTAGLALPRAPIRTVPISDVVMRERAHQLPTPTEVIKSKREDPYLYLRIKGETLGYVLHRLQGRFPHPQALDGLLYRPPIQQRATR